MRRLNKAWLFLALALPASSEMLEDVVARVNGKPILLSEYRKNVRAVIDNYQRSMPQALRDEEMVKEIHKKVLDQMIDDELLIQEGERMGLKVHSRELEKGIDEVQERSFREDERTGQKRSDAQMRAALLEELRKEGLGEEQFRERIRRQIIQRKVEEERVRPNLKEPDEKRLRAAFERFKAVASGSTDVVKGMSEEEGQATIAFGMRLKDGVSERVRVAHILVKTGPGAGMVARSQALARAQEIKKKLSEGADFGETAVKESDDAESAPRGGDLGFLLRGWMPKEFEDAAFSLPVGDASDPVETKFGFHILRVTEKRAKESLNYDKVKGEMTQFLYGLDRQTELIRFVKKLRASATVEVLQTQP
jgi:parvulin-like peptidyl-prolyl isomerase